jgi:23S rRNA (adenine2503-C2)-methyltransferase
MTDLRPLLEWRLTDLVEYLAESGEPAFRARQIFRWIFGGCVFDFDLMTDLPTELRRRLGGALAIRTGDEVRRSEAPDGTSKVLLRWRDGATTECVMIPADGRRSRRTVCLSTQVGCDVGCRFCASGIGGSLRNLTPGEILEQALAIQSLLAARGERLSHVVFMGMGEPLANYHATVEAVRRLSAVWGLEISQRRITISTVGLPKQILHLADEGLQVTLALSLHAARDSLRRELIPWAESLPLPDVLAACRTYFLKTGREVTLEYCLLAGVNDGRSDVIPGRATRSRRQRPPAGKPGSRGGCGLWTAAAPTRRRTVVTQHPVPRRHLTLQQATIAVSLSHRGISDRRKMRAGCS